METKTEVMHKRFDLVQSSATAETPMANGSAVVPMKCTTIVDGKVGLQTRKLLILFHFKFKTSGHDDIGHNAGYPKWWKRHCSGTYQLKTITKKELSFTNGGHLNTVNLVDNCPLNLPKFQLE